MTDPTAVQLTEAEREVRLAEYVEEWGWHEATDDTLAGYGHHMSQMLYRLPRDGQTDDMRLSIEAMLADLADFNARMSQARAEGDALRAVVRLAEHLASEVVGGGRCTLTADRNQPERDEAWSADRGRCAGEVVAVRWEDGFADPVCRSHATNAGQRGAVVVYPKRHDGTHRAALSTQPTPDVSAADGMVGR